jgi:hypothetical protein
VRAFFLDRNCSARVIIKIPETFLCADNSELLSALGGQSHDWLFTDLIARLSFYPITSRVVVIPAGYKGLTLATFRDRDQRPTRKLAHKALCNLC